MYLAVGTESQIENINLGVTNIMYLGAPLKEHTQRKKMRTYKYP